ncbi:MAG: ribbon-helix-helix protein, CopG family [Verrucomicrobia bacterium]|nr:ribbon-helix-helix protein, CopG family [Verrucomicrobiota bacterium]
MAEKQNFSIRLDSDLKAEVERVAALGGVSPSDVIRVCVSKGLPILAEGYQLIHERFVALRSRPLGTPLVSSEAAGDLTGAEAAAL